ncbi:hypothetical protein [Phytohabitans kaempferiae]|uniref:Uncharacterized protein n=1 Tax=Phytohabitans kaempferiae TaxID=1620943 RepID=A0ABV6MCE0_9ACTN
MPIVGAGMRVTGHDRLARQSRLRVRHAGRFVPPREAAMKALRPPAPR